MEKKRVSFPSVDNEVAVNFEDVNEITFPPRTDGAHHPSLSNLYYSINSRPSVFSPSLFSHSYFAPNDRLNSIDGQPFDARFFSTSRRSHAFSVSAIDESLQESADEADDEPGNALPRNVRRRLEKLHQGDNRLYRHSQIPVMNADCEIRLFHTKNQTIDLKSFRDEIRSVRDMESFFANPYVLLNPNGNTLPVIINQMLEMVLKADILSDAYQSLFPKRCTIQLTELIQGIYQITEFSQQYDPTWFCTFITINRLEAKRVVIARLRRPANFGPTLGQVHFVILILCPPNQKATKSAFEVGRTFATLFADLTLRTALMNASGEEEFCTKLQERVRNLQTQEPKRYGSQPSLSDPLTAGRRLRKMSDKTYHPIKLNQFKFPFGKGLAEDFMRRIRYYPSDFLDGIIGPKTLMKVTSSTLSIFFACILPCLAFGVIDAHNTDRIIGPKEALLGQAIGGLIFALFSGQPLVIIATTAPLCLFTSIVYQIAANTGVDFLDLFAAVGLWNALFLILYSLFSLSNLMHLCTRSTEEIFATFIFFAFTVDALKECVESFQTYYCFESAICSPDKSILFLFLMLGTVAVALLFYNFSSTPYLSSLLRETLADYALPLAIIVFSLIGSLAFKQVHAESYAVSADFQWRIATLKSLNWPATLLSIILGFALSILFFIDQNVSAALVAAPSNRLKKGTAYHWDLLVVALLNIVLSLIGLPWMHGILPHSPMHARSLADMAPASSPHSSQSSMVVVRIRETRITGILIHILIGLVVILIPAVLSHIPVAVLCGLFLYCAVSTLRDNSLFERVLLLFTEQSSYPPTHYLRLCPQRTVHWFTTAQLIQLALICFVGFAPWEYLQLVFPVFFALLIPIRWYLLPRFLNHQHLLVIDSKHI